MPSGNHTVQVQVSQQTAICNYTTSLDVTDSQIITEIFPLNHFGDEFPILGPPPGDYNRRSPPRTVH